MRYELFIGLRYLRAKRKEAFLSMITLISTVGLIIGVMTLNVVLSVFSGFEEDLRDRILGFNPQIVVHSVTGIVDDAAELTARIAGMPEVEAAAPFVYGQVMLSVQQKIVGVVVRGVGPEAERVINLQRLLKEGRVEALAQRQSVAPNSPTARSEPQAAIPGVILGREVARQLDVKVGERVNVVSPTTERAAIAMVPRMEPFVVVGTFDSGMAEYDSQLIYMDIGEARRFFALGDGVTGIEARLHDPFQAKEIGRKIRERLGVPYRVRDWMDLNHNLFAAMQVGKTVYFIVLLLVVLVATFNIVSMLIMVVMEKRKDIAVLKSMGATRTGVGRIFVYKGLIIGAIGTIVGNLAAFGTCLLLQSYRFIELPRDVYGIDTLKVKMHPEYFVAVTLASLLLCLLATVYPARQAARLSPVDVIRYE